MEKEKEKKIILSREIQKSMIEFFLKTSIQRKKRQTQAHLSKLKEDR